MAEPVTHACVADTHALLFHAAGGKRLGHRAARHFRACEDHAAITYVPAAVLWETSCLVRVGRVDLHRSLREFFGDLFANPAWQLPAAGFSLDAMIDQLVADVVREEEGNVSAAARRLGVTRDFLRYRLGERKSEKDVTD